MKISKQNRGKSKGRTHVSGLVPTTSPALQGFVPTGWKTVSNPPTHIQGPKNKVPSFSFSDRTFRDMASSPRTGTRGGKGAVRHDGITKLISPFFIKPTKNLFSFPRALPPREITRAIVASALLLGGCSHVQKQTHTIDAKFTAIADFVPQDGPLDIAPASRTTVISGSEDGKARTLKSERIRTTKFDGPIRFAFTDVPVDLILRRISEFTDLQFIADESLIASSFVTLDLTVTTSEEIYDLVEIVGTMLGVNVKWEGKKAIITAANTQGTRPSDGYLITPIKLSQETAEIVAARYEVQCSRVSTLTLCLGVNDNLDVTQKFIKAVDNARDLISYRLVTTDADLSTITKALNLDDRLSVTSLKNNQWLLVANDPRHFNLVLEVTENVSTSTCEEFIFTPLHVPSSVLANLVISEPNGACPPSVFVGNRIVLSGSPFDVLAARNLLVKMDRPKPLARVHVLIGSNSDLRDIGADIEGFAGRIPAADWLDAPTLSASVNYSSGWRSVEIMTDGQSTANVTSTDRVEGNVIVTDGGSQVQGVENRTVGLSIELNGVVTRSGYRGRVSFTDSSLDGDVTRSSQCAAFVSLDMHQVAKVCEYDRDDASRQYGILSANDRKAADALHVYIAVLNHETASFDTLRKLVA